MNRAEELALLLKPPDKSLNRTASIEGSRNLRPDSPRQADQRSSPVEIPIVRQDSNPVSQSVIFRSRASSNASNSTEIPINRPLSSDQNAGELSNSFQDSNMGITSIDFQQAVSNQHMHTLSNRTNLSNQDLAET